MRICPKVSFDTSRINCSTRPASSLSNRSSSSRIGRSPFVWATMAYCASLRAIRKDFCCPCDPYLRKGITSDFQHQVVAVNARRREFVDDVLLPRIEQHLLERTVVQLRFVVQFDLLPVAREDAVIGRGHGLQPLGELLPPGVDGRLPCSHSCMS